MKFQLLTILTLCSLILTPVSNAQLGQIKQNVNKVKKVKENKDKKAEAETKSETTTTNNPGEGNSTETNQEEITPEVTTAEEPVQKSPLTKIEKGTILSSEYHKEHVGEIVFSDQVVAFKNEDPSKLKTSFTFGEVIRFRAYFQQSFYNTMVDKFNELGISKEEAYDKAFLPVCKIKYFVDDKLAYETFYGSNKREYNNNNFPPYAYSNYENAYQTNVEYTTFQGSLFNTTFSHDEITHFTELFDEFTPGETHTVKMQIIALDYLDQENTAKHVLVSEGSFSLNCVEMDIADNEAICMPKPVKHTEVEGLLKKHLQGQTFSKFSLASVSNTSDNDGKIQRIEFYLGIKEEDQCYLEFRVYNRRYNYITGTYSNEFEIIQVSRDSMPCACLQ